MLQFDPCIQVDLPGQFEAPAAQAAAACTPLTGDTKVDNPRRLIGADQDILLALQVAMGNAGCMHRLDRRQQPREEGFAIIQCRRRLTQGRASDIAHYEMLAGGKAEAARNTRHPGETFIDTGFAPDAAATEPGKEGIRMRALDDQGAGRAAQPADDGLVAVSDQLPLGQMVEQPVFERGVDRELVRRAGV